jgi:hypothetical protein
MSEELERVRYQLMKLAMTRLLCPLTDRDQEEYDRLARRERQLMALEKASFN